jgi:hypothetical protein
LAESIEKNVDLFEHLVTVPIAGLFTGFIGSRGDPDEAGV